MEQHPVPQNVTTFQFRLIGDMTLKQFGYLASGAILAYLCYRLPLPLLLNWPLAVAFALLGFGLAFVPIEERPMDVWILSFFKSIYSPTEYVWHKTAGTSAAPTSTPMVQQTTRPTAPSPMPQPTPRPITHGPSLSQTISRLFSFGPHATAAPKQTIRPAPAPGVPTIKPTAPPRVIPMVITHRPFQPFDWIKDMFASKPKPRAVDTSLPDIFTKVPIASVAGKRLDLTSPPRVAEAPQVTQAVSEAQKKTAALEERLGKLQGELQSKTVTEDRILELQKQLTDALAERQTLQAELLAIRQKLDTSMAGATYVPQRTASIASPVATASAPTVKVISPDAAVKAGLPRLTSFPNVVTGIIKDNGNNFLPGVLVTVRDPEGVPLRALKTNKLGQFAASTPLPNGTYLLEVEDPRNRFVFDRAQITVNGTIVPTIEIIAKSQKELSREKLAKEIFGSQTAS